MLGRQPVRGISVDIGVFKRTTFIVANAEASADFYRKVFGWSVWYDNIVRADHRFPPSGAADMAEVHLIILEARDPKVGKLGLLQYLDPPFDEGAVQGRTKVRMGEPILVVQTDDVDGVHERAIAAGASVITRPVDWQVPSRDGKSVIKLRTISMFDPNGIYMEVSEHP